MITKTADLPQKNWQNVSTQIIKMKNSYGIEDDTMKIETILLCETK